MNIQNNRAAEVLYSTTYVEDYLESVETLPDEIQRLVSRLIGLDADAQNYLQKVRDYFAQLVRLNKRNNRNGNEELIREIGRVHGHITVTLMKSQEIGDEKIQVAQQVQDFLDNRLRQLEIDRKTLDSVQKQAEVAAASSYSSRDRDSHQRSNTGSEPSTSDRGIKRVRRARLGPSIIPHKPVVAATSTVPLHVTPQSEKRSEGISSSVTPSNFEVPSPSPSTPHIEKVKEKVKSSTQHAPTTPASSSSSQEHRKDPSTPSTSSAPPAKKRAIDASEPVAAPSTPVVEPEVVEKKSEVVLRTPKKKEKKVQVQKSSERKQSSVSASSTTKRTAAKRKAQQMGAFTDIDPDEPTYCVCDQVSYGEMIGCDNDLCPIEWFHFSCVQLNIKPKGKWYCPTCRDGKPNMMKTKEAFLKELEKYNREREGR